MNSSLVDRIVNAVLYEGYILYPYRPSVKSRQRWTFGGLYPPCYCEAHPGSDSWFIQTECLVEGSERTRLQVEVRFLHLLNRHIGALDQPCRELAEGEQPPFHVVEKLRVGDRLLHTWQEALERRLSIAEIDLAALPDRPSAQEFEFPENRQIEPVRDAAENVVALLIREQQGVVGRVEAFARPVAAGLYKLQVRIENHTPLKEAADRTRDEALVRSLISTHTVLGVKDGAFVSLLDPPEQWRAAAADCCNAGTWPVLVGEAGERDTMLSSPITLYDYPKVAPESPGDLFDSTEIDEILSLRILTLTDEEKQTAAAVDERARALLHRTETLDREQLLRLHGTIRGMQPLPEEGYDA